MIVESEKGTNQMPFLLSEGDAISFETKVHVAFKEKIKLTINAM
jgi:hypothetical protein